MNNEVRQGNLKNITLSFLYLFLATLSLLSHCSQSTGQSCSNNWNRFTRIPPFLLGEVKTSNTDMGLVGGSIPLILYTTHNIICPILTLYIFQINQIIFMNEPLGLLSRNTPLVNPELNPCLLDIVGIIKQALHILFFI